MTFSQVLAISTAYERDARIFDWICAISGALCGVTVCLDFYYWAMLIFDVGHLDFVNFVQLHLAFGISLACALGTHHYSNLCLDRAYQVHRAWCADTNEQLSRELCEVLLGNTVTRLRLWRWYGLFKTHPLTRIARH